jgi:hypothetical protein
VISRHPDVFHQEPAEQEVHLAGEGIEVVAETGGPGGCREPTEIDRGTTHGLAPENATVESDVRALILGNLLQHLTQVFVLPRYDVAASDGSGTGPGIRIVHAPAGDSAEVVLGLEGLEIQREVEDVSVRDRVRDRACRSGCQHAARAGR